MLCAIGASFVFQGLTGTLVGNSWVVLGVVVGFFGLSNGLSFWTQTVSGLSAEVE